MREYGTSVTRVIIVFVTAVVEKARVFNFQALYKRKFPSQCTSQSEAEIYHVHCDKCVCVMFDSFERNREREEEN